MNTLGEHERPSAGEATTNWTLISISAPRGKRSCVWAGNFFSAGERGSTGHLDSMDVSDGLAGDLTHPGGQILGGGRLLKTAMPISRAAKEISKRGDAAKPAFVAAARWGGFWCVHRRRQEVRCGAGSPRKKVPRRETQLISARSPRAKGSVTTKPEFVRSPPMATFISHSQRQTRTLERNNGARTAPARPRHCAQAATSAQARRNWCAALPAAGLTTSHPRRRSRWSTNTAAGG